MIQPPDCIKDGQPPCPTCPVAEQCDWGRHMLIMDAETYHKKLEKGT